MKQLSTYVPIVVLLLVLYSVEASWLKWLAMGGIGILAVVAKLKRRKLQEEDIVADDRVNANIAKWSLQTMLVMNALLLAVLVMQQLGILAVQLDAIIVYLAISLCVPFYVVPTIAKYV